MADLDPTRLARLIEPFRVEPGRKVRLPKDFDPGDTAGWRRKDAGEILAEGIELLSEYQTRLAAQDTYALLVVLQALDAAGKDGTIQHVMSGVNPQGVSVHSFKVPSAEELDHDYLWRASKVLPARGEIGIFNRSYYEEVLVVRVHPAILEGEKLPPESKRKGVWERRFREINDWERYLHDNGIRMVKLFLNVSKEEQRRRFLARIDEPDKNWKFSAGDVRERAFWDAYQEAFADVLSRTSTEEAPWYVIPADHKWFARLAASAVIVDALRRIDPHYPVASEAARADLMKAKAELEAEAPAVRSAATPAGAVEAETGPEAGAARAEAPRPQAESEGGGPGPEPEATTVVAPRATAEDGPDGNIGRTDAGSRRKKAKGGKSRA